MTPEKTSYYTQGPDGVKRLKAGPPNINSYRGLNVINTRSFSMETGQPPRDVLRRSVRVAEYYRIPASEDNNQKEFEFYNEARDNWFSLRYEDLLNMARLPDDDDDDDDDDGSVATHGNFSYPVKTFSRFSGNDQSNFGVQFSNNVPMMGHILRR